MWGGIRMAFTMIIADDEAMALKSEELFIKKEFPDIEIVGKAANGIELKRMLEELNPDIAIVDIHMPGLHGIEVIELLQHKNHLKTRYIINTAYSNFEYMKQALNLKTDGYMLKPGKTEEWTATVRRLCDSIEEARREAQKREDFQKAVDTVGFVLGREILQSIFLGKIDEKAFETYCSLNQITFCEGCIAVLLPETKNKPDKKSLNRELQEVLERLCEYLVTVTENGVVMMLFVPPEIKEDKRQAWCEELVILIAKRLEEVFHSKWLSAVGGIYPSIGEMRRSYLDSIQKFGMVRQGVAGIKEEGLDKTDFYVAKTKQYVDAYFQKDLSLAECAADVGISPYYLSHIFPEKMGRTFIEYLSEKRIEEAKKLAVNERLTIKDISERVGYLNVTYFCKIFKKVTGETIGEYRKKNRRK